MQRNFKNALKPVVKRGMLNRVGNFVRGFTRRNARVAPENMNGVPKVKQTIYGIEEGSTKIAPNLGTPENKSRIFDENFEQTFIKESISTLLASLDINKSKYDKNKFLNEYTTRLRNTECSEVEAIYLYDRLISIFILSTVGAIVAVVHEYDSYALNRIRHEYRDELLGARKLLLPLIDKVRFKDSSLFLSFINIVLVFIFGTITGGVAGFFGAIGVALGAILVFSLTYRRKKLNFEGQFFILPQKCLEIMFSTENTIPIQGLKNRLKFWGMSQMAVDYIFSIGTYGRNIEDIPVENRQLQNSTQDECSICFTPYTEEPEKTTTKLECGHKFHTECLAGWFRRQDEQGQEHRCPTCRRAISSPLTLLPTFDMRPSEMSRWVYGNFFINLSQYMFLAKYQANKSNIPFSKDVIDYHYTMYDSPGTTRANIPGTTRANVRRRGPAAIETSKAALEANGDFGLPALPGSPYDGGSRRRNRKQKQKRRKTRR